MTQTTQTTQTTAFQQIGAASLPVFNEYWEAIESFRSDLWRYCRKLTGTPWDAEDLFQDTMLKAFASLSAYSHRNQPLQAKSFLFRVATNHWIDQCRRMKIELDEYEDVHHAQPATVDALEIDEAVQLLLRHLPPKQAVVLILMDSFSFTAKETAVLINTTEGAVHATLNRARTKLRALRQNGAPGDQHQLMSPGKPVHPEAVKKFLDLYNRKDFHEIANLLIDNSTMSFVTMLSTEYGKEVITKYSLNPNKGSKLTDDIHVYTDLLWGRQAFIYTRQTEQGPMLHDVNTIEWEDGKITRWNCYYFCRDFMHAAAATLGLPLAPEKWA